MELQTIIGLIAACCTTIAFLPQVLLTLKTRDTRAISLSMYLIFTLGVALWLIYGILLQELPLILANGLTLILASIILILKIKYK